MSALMNALGRLARVMVALMAVAVGLLVAAVLAATLIVRLAFARGRQAAAASPVSPTRTSTRRVGGLGTGEVVDIEPRQVRPTSP